MELFVAAAGLCTRIECAPAQSLPTVGTSRPITSAHCSKGPCAWAGSVLGQRRRPAGRCLLADRHGSEESVVHLVFSRSRRRQLVAMHSSLRTMPSRQRGGDHHLPRVQSHRWHTQERAGVYLPWTGGSSPNAACSSRNALQAPAMPHLAHRSAAHVCVVRACANVYPCVSVDAAWLTSVLHS